MNLSRFSIKETFVLHDFICIYKKYQVELIWNKKVILTFVQIKEQIVRCYLVSKILKCEPEFLENLKDVETGKGHTYHIL